MTLFQRSIPVGYLSLEIQPLVRVMHKFILQRIILIYKDMYLNPTSLMRWTESDRTLTQEYRLFIASSAQLLMYSRCPVRRVPSSQI